MIVSGFGFQGGVLSGINTSTLNYGLWTQIEDGIPVTNTIDEKTLLGSGLGTLSVPANNFQVGDTFSLKMCGTLNAQNNSQLTITLHSNGVDIGSSGLLTLVASTLSVWELTALFTIRAIGISGDAILSTNGSFNYVGNASSNLEGVNFTNIDSTTFDTTIINVLDVVAQWGSASVLDSINTTQVVLTKLF